MNDKIASKVPVQMPAGCPASAVVAAARAAKTPLAVADASSEGFPIMFANDAFADKLGRDPTSLVGCSLDGLGHARAPIELREAARGARIVVQRSDGSLFEAALSVAEVPGPSGLPFCLLCSLMEVRGEGADEDIARDAELLAQVAGVAGELLLESDAAARTLGLGSTAGSIAEEALSRVSAAGGDTLT